MSALNEKLVEALSTVSSLSTKMDHVNDRLSIKENAGHQFMEEAKQVMSVMIDDALARYAADMLGKPDYALESSGGRVISSVCGF